MANAAVLILSAVFLVWVDTSARAGRHLSAVGQKSGPVQVVRVPTHLDAYRFLRDRGTRGVLLVQFDRFFSMVEYFPKTEATSRPFPIEVYDVRPSYELALDRQNWLFIATRTGMVRAIISVLPDTLFADRMTAFGQDPGYRITGETISGFSYDVPRVITTVQGLSLIEEPVIAMVSAGFFSDGADPEASALSLLKRCPDLRALILVEGLDDEESNDADREALGRFSAFIADGRT